MKWVICKGIVSIEKRPGMSQLTAEMQPVMESNYRDWWNGGAVSALVGSHLYTVCYSAMGRERDRLMPERT